MLEIAQWDYSGFWWGEFFKYFGNFDGLKKEIFDSLKNEILTVWNEIFWHFGKGNFWQFKKGNFDNLKRKFLTVWNEKFWQFETKNFDTLEKENFDSLKRKFLTVWNEKFLHFGKGNFDSLKREILTVWKSKNFDSLISPFFKSPAPLRRALPLNRQNKNGRQHLHGSCWPDTRVQNYTKWFKFSQTLDDGPHWICASDESYVEEYQREFL
jgi:hypothetical protein